MECQFQTMFLASPEAPLFKGAHAGLSRAGSLIELCISVMIYLKAASATSSVMNADT